MLCMNVQQFQAMLAVGAVAMQMQSNLENVGFFKNGHAELMLKIHNFRLNFKQEETQKLVLKKKVCRGFVLIFHKFLHKLCKLPFGTFITVAKRFCGSINDGFSAPAVADGDIAQGRMEER